MQAKACRGRLEFTDVVLERHRGRPQLTRCLSPEFQAGSPKATVQASGFSRILELGRGFPQGRFEDFKLCACSQGPASGPRRHRPLPLRIPRFLWGGIQVNYKQGFALREYKGIEV